MPRLLLIVFGCFLMAGSGWLLSGSALSASGDECPREKLSCASHMPIYSDIYRKSYYVDLPGGARVAVDVLRPVGENGVVEEKLPVLFVHAIYNRSVRLVHDYEVRQSTLISFGTLQSAVLWTFGLFNGGEIVMDQAGMMPWIDHLVRQGYVVVAADASGTGASYGVPMRSMETYGREASLLMDWIVEQPWSNGKIGIYGQSFHALTAYAAIAQQHPALKAAFVSSPPLDSYRSVGFPGGVRNTGFGESYVAITSDLDVIATPVDGNHAEAEFLAARASRQGQSFSDMVADVMRTAPHQDDLSERLGLSWDEMSGLPLMERVRDADVAIYNIGGLRDIFSKDAIFWDANLVGDKRLVIRPWHHRVLNAQMNDYDTAIHAQAWFDRWLKDRTETGQPADGVSYFSLAGISEEAAEGQWCSAERWPPESAQVHRFYLTSDQRLNAAVSSEGGAAVRIEADADATTGVDSRWNGVLTAGGYADFRDARIAGQSFTSLPVEEPLSIAGHPILNFQARFPDGEAAVHVVLEKLTAEGNRLYLSEAVLRPTQTQLATALYDALGLPVFDHRRAVALPLEREKTYELEIDLLPVATHIGAGERLRLTFTAEDKDNYAPLNEGSRNGYELVFDSADAASVSFPEVPCRP